MWPLLRETEPKTPIKIDIESIIDCRFQVQYLRVMESLPTPVLYWHLEMHIDARINDPQTNRSDVLRLRKSHRCNITFEKMFVNDRDWIPSCE